MNIVHNWFRSGWSWYAALGFMAGLVLVNFEGVFLYVGSGLMIGSFILLFESFEEEDRSNV